MWTGWATAPARRRPSSCRGAGAARAGAPGRPQALPRARRCRRRLRHRWRAARGPREPGRRAHAEPTGGQGGSDEPPALLLQLGPGRRRDRDDALPRRHRLRRLAARPVAWAILPLVNMLVWSGCPCRPRSRRAPHAAARPFTTRAFGPRWSSCSPPARPSSRCRSGRRCSPSRPSMSPRWRRIAGPAAFAVLMGLGRVAYGLGGERIPILRVLIASGVFATACYLVAPWHPTRSSASADAPRAGWRSASCGPARSASRPDGSRSGRGDVRRAGGLR